MTIERIQELFSTPPASGNRTSRSGLQYSMTVENVSAENSTEATSIVQKTLKLDDGNISDILVLDSMPSPRRVNLLDDQAQSEDGVCEGSSKRLFTLQVSFSEQAELN